MKEKLGKFMIGRYGADQLNRFLLIVALFFLVANLLFRTELLSIVSMLLLVWCYYRMFSRNTGKRYKENQIYMGYQSRVTDFFCRLRFKFDQSKRFHIYLCPGCKQKIRVPRGKGKISIHCPKCGNDFVKKS